MFTRIEAFGDFGLTRERPTFVRVCFGLLASFASMQVAGWILLTQWLADRLDHQPGLGGAFLEIAGRHLYLPWRHFLWRAQLAGAPGADELLRKTSRWSELTTFVAVVLTAYLTGQWLRRGRNRADELHGSAAFADRKKIAAAGLLSPQGVVVGQWRDRNKTIVLRHDGPEGILLFAPPRSGKGVGPILSTLLSWKHSCIVLDPRGENAQFSSGWRAHRGQRMFILNFAAPPEATAGFNPLDTVRVGTSAEVADAQRLAQMIVDPDGKQAEGQNAHWAETAAALLTGAILHVLYRERQHGASACLADVMAELTDPDRKHNDVLQEWLTCRHERTAGSSHDDADDGRATHPVVAAAARAQLNREERERTAVLSSAVAKLELFRDPRVATNTAHSSFRIEDLMDGEVPTTVYLVLSPADIKRLRPLVRIFLDCTLRRLMEEARFGAGPSSEQTHKHRLLLLMDEFPVLGNMAIFTEALAYCAGFGIKPFLVAQDYEQLKSIYGEREIISSNCNLWLAYAPNKVETAQMLAARLGKTTVRVRTRKGFGRNAQTSEHEVARDLRTAGEIMALRAAHKEAGRITRPGEMLLFTQGTAVLCEQPLYFLNPALKGRKERAPAPCTPTPWDDKAWQDQREAGRQRHALAREEDAQRAARKATAAAAAAELDELVEDSSNLFEDAQDERAEEGWS